MPACDAWNDDHCGLSTPLSRCSGLLFETCAVGCLSLRRERRAGSIQQRAEQRQVFHVFLHFFSLRGLQHFRNCSETGLLHDEPERLQPDFPFADVIVPVQRGSPAGPLRVVQVKCGQPFFRSAVELRKGRFTPRGWRCHARRRRDAPCPGKCRAVRAALFIQDPGQFLKSTGRGSVPCPAVISNAIRTGFPGSSEKSGPGGHYFFQARLPRPPPCRAGVKQEEGEFRVAPPAPAPPSGCARSGRGNPDWRRQVDQIAGMAEDAGQFAPAEVFAKASASLAAQGRGERIACCSSRRSAWPCNPRRAPLDGDSAPARSGNWGARQMEIGDFGMRKSVDRGICLIDGRLPAGRRERDYSQKAILAVPISL